MLLLAKNSTLPKLIRNGRLFLGGALLGVLVFVLVFGVSTLDVTNDAFCRGGYIEKDIQQHYAGWLFYRQSSAGWPLCIARGINYPDGLSIAYTDSIPLVAALLKPVANLVGGTFQYMGWFTLVCFALQGGFGALLAGLFLPGCAAPLAADLLFVTSPVLFERVFRHTSLGAQFFVLAALYFYFAARRKGQYASRGLFVLSVLAVGIHPYFLPMTYAITLALLLEYALHNRQLAGPGLYLAANFGGTAYLGGQAGAGAIMDVLTGRVNPSGKLAETLPLTYEDTPAARYFPGKQQNVEYREGLYIGYRYYETAHVPVRYPFGYGLSYTTFAYSDLKADADKVTFTITNTGSRAGAEIAQLYVAKADAAVFRPEKELKGFAKVFLQAGECKTVTIPLDRAMYSRMSTSANTTATKL